MSQNTENIYSPAKFANFLYICITRRICCENANFSACNANIHTKFANFACRAIFLYFATNSPPNFAILLILGSCLEDLYHKHVWIRTSLHDFCSTQPIYSEVHDLRLLLTAQRRCMH